MSLIHSSWSGLNLTHISSNIVHNPGFICPFIIIHSSWSGLKLSNISSNTVQKSWDFYPFYAGLKFPLEYISRLCWFKVVPWVTLGLNSVFTLISVRPESSGDPKWVLQFSFIAHPTKSGDECSRCVEYWHTVVPPLSNTEIVMVPWILLQERSTHGPNGRTDISVKTEFNSLPWLPGQEPPFVDPWPLGTTHPVSVGGSEGISLTPLPFSGRSSQGGRSAGGDMHLQTGPHWSRCDQVEHSGGKKKKKRLQFVLLSTSCSRTHGLRTYMYCACARPVGQSLAVNLV